MPATKPTVHLICNAHLDPVWQWRWEEGASEAIATFRTAADLLDEDPGLVFCHNESVLYEWVERLAPRLFARIRRHVRAGRWAIAGGWFLQPDTNLPGLESIIRQIEEGRRYFRSRFGAVPRVAYNFDSFGHSGGLPQVLVRAGYGMYIHMRPQAEELPLPADLYRWRGVDGSEILAYRIEIGLYHTEYDNLESRIRAATEKALALGRDVAVFWGIGDHGGGATREDLALIREAMSKERRVRIIHSTPDRLFASLRPAGNRAPVFGGGLQRCFTGCYTSLSRVKRAAVASLGTLVQAEALGTAAWWSGAGPYPEKLLGESWKAHLFNDFHDVISGSCVEPAERDALAIYGQAEDGARRARLEAAAALNLRRASGAGGRSRAIEIPVTVLNANPSLTRVPVEVEGMISHRPKWTGTWEMRLFDPGGREIVRQEEQPEALLPFNGWRRKLVFLATLPGIGVARYEAKALEKGAAGPSGGKPALSTGVTARSGTDVLDRLDESGTIAAFDCGTGLARLFVARSAGEEGEGGTAPLAGPFPRPVPIRDEGDSWGTGLWRYRDAAGEFRLSGAPAVVEDGPVRTIVESVFVHKESRVVLRTILYPDWPVIEHRFRIQWNEARRRLKLVFPTALVPRAALAEVPGGAVAIPADGEEHVHGRWGLVEGEAGGRRIAVGIAGSGQHGIHFEGGEIGLSVLRGSAYCRERGFALPARPSIKCADQGVHEFRLLVIAGDPADVRRALPGLADWLACPPAAYAHLPFGAVGAVEEILSIEPANVRLLSFARAEDGRSLRIRLHEAAGVGAAGRLRIRRPGSGSAAPVEIRLSFEPYEIKTIRLTRSGTWAPIDMIDAPSRGSKRRV